MIKNIVFKINSTLLFVVAFTLITFFSGFQSFGEEKLLKEEKNYRDWSIFVSKNDPVTCFVASQSVKSEAYKNGQKLSSVNREKGTIYIIKKKNKENEYEGTFYAGYPLQVGSKAKLSIDKKMEIVFFAHPSPKEKAEKEHAWAQKYDEEKLISYLKKGSKAILSAVSHSNTVTKDTFMLTGFSDALMELGKLCKQ